MEANWLESRMSSESSASTALVAVDAYNDEFLTVDFRERNIEFCVKKALDDVVCLSTFCPHIPIGRPIYILKEKGAAIAESILLSPCGSKLSLNSAYGSGKKVRDGRHDLVKVRELGDGMGGRGSRCVGKTEGPRAKLKKNLEEESGTQGLVDGEQRDELVDSGGNDG
ncbi:Uncharacterized protein Fot_24834 [Forsythia ovata]|uniref:Uncharacterized protein n=1 Tax=Forsythia ovata TaxID=205694 RepID=A0ABD1U7F7_9LAMI